MDTNIQTALRAKLLLTLIGYGCDKRILI